jgi:hypothetical protein
MNEAEVKDLADGRYGIYIGGRLLGVAKTERQADLGVSLINDALGTAYDDGREAGLREGYFNGLDDCEDCDGSYDEGFQAGRDEGLADGRNECDK